VLIKFKMALPWKPRYQSNGVGWCPLLLCNGNSSYYYSSSFSSRRDFVRTNSQRLTIRHYGEYSYDVSWSLIKEN
jgi:hypothetical protein